MLCVEASSLCPPVMMSFTFCLREYGVSPALYEGERREDGHVGFDRAKRERVVEENKRNDEISSLVLPVRCLEYLLSHSRTRQMTLDTLLCIEKNVSRDC